MNEDSRQAADDRARSADEEDVKKLVEIRTSLQERIGELEGQLDEWRTLLAILDQRLTRVSFKKAAIPEAAKVEPERPLAVPAEVGPEYERIVPLKAGSGVLLAELQIGDELLRVVPADGIRLTSSIPPFESFLINRIFGEMIKNDEERIRNEEIPTGMKFAYEIREAEDGTIEEIRINNYRTDRRLRELRNSLRWTLEKMYEKLPPDASA